MTASVVPKSEPQGKMATHIQTLLRCPSHLESELLLGSDGHLYCNESDCANHRTAFLEVAQQPVLINFDRSVCQPEAFAVLENGSLLNRRRSRVAKLVKRVIWGTSHRTRHNVEVFLQELKRDNPNPILLIVGGGAVGSGSEALYNDPDVRVMSFDIYASEHTDFVADAHDIPLKDGAVDGVWIQAVLEHVLEPQRVVAEIHRVLQPEGLVYSETPFMQQVHEKAYDFTRFTESGHRWLFKHFSLIQSGTVLGPGTALLWSMRHFAAGLFRLKKAGELLAVMFFWLRLLDRLIPAENTSDAASAVFFLGRKAEQPIRPGEVIQFYRGVR